MALILKRAAELQEGADGRGPQLSLAEIKAIAVEAGISPAFVSEAAAELQQTSPRVGWLGAPTRFHEERTTPGVLSASDAAEIVDCVRKELGLHGEVSQVLETVEWRAQSSLGWTFLTLVPRAGGTRVTITAARGDQAVLVGAGAVGIGILSALWGVWVALAVADSPLVASLIIAGSGVAGTIASARLLWRGVAARWQRRTRQIADALAERAAQLVSRDDSGTRLDK